MEEFYSYIDGHIDEAAQELMRLCRQPSVSAKRLGVGEMAELLADVLRKRSFSVRLLPVPGRPFPVVYGELSGDSPTTLLLYNHYDVQPEEPLELWNSPPFEPTISQGKLFARGASDNKGNIAARLAAISAFQAVRGSLPVSIKFCIEGEEEIGSPGLLAFVQENRELLRADACIWEGGGVDWQGRPTVVLGLKGILYLELEAKGAASDLHSSYAAVVPSPAWRLVWALSTLKDAGETILIDGFYDEVSPPSPAELEAVAAMPAEDEEFRQTLGIPQFLKGVSGTEYRKRHLFEPSLNICGLVSGYTGEGSKTVLPNLARAKVDIRLVPKQRPEDIMEKLRRHLDRHGFSDIVIHSAMEGEHPARTPMDAPFVALVRDTARQVYGKEPVLIPTWAGSGPMYPFTHTLGLPTASSGVEYPECGMHAPNEHIRLTDLALGIKHMAAIMMRLGEKGL